MSAQRLRTFLPFLPSLLLVIFLVSCEDGPTDPDDRTNDTNTVDTNGVGGENGNLAPRGTDYELEVEWDYEDPAFTDRTETSKVGVDGKLRDYAGRKNVLLYSMPAGFVTDRVFRGNVVEESNGDLSVYYIGNMLTVNDLWWFQGWGRYPINGAKATGVMHDSTNPSGTRRQRVTWSAESDGTETISVKGKTYTAQVILWEMEATRWSNGTVDLELLYSGEDLWVPELAYVAERYMETWSNQELFLTTVATLVDHNVPVD